MNTTLKTRLLVMLGVLSISFAAILVKLSTATALNNAFYRMFISALITLVPLIKNRKLVTGISKKAWIWMAVSGIALGLHFFTWFISLAHTSIANSMVLITMSPIFTVAGGALLFNARFKKQELMMIAVAIVGSIIMAMHTGRLEQGEMFGNMMAFLGAFLIGVYLLIGNYLRREVATLVYTFTVYMSASMILLLVSLLAGEDVVHHTGREWLIFILLAIVPTLMGHSLFSYALKYVKAAFISTAVLFEPVLTILLAAWIFKEYPDMIQMLGGGIILSALLVYTTLSKENEEIQAS